MFKFNISPFILKQRMRQVYEGVKKTDSILDVGCGYGSLIEALPYKTIKYTGVDLDKDLIKDLKKKYPKHDFFIYDLEKNLKNKLGFFDKIFVLALVEHLSNIDNLLISLKKYSKNDTEIVVTTPTFLGYYLHRFLSLFGIVSRKAALDHKRCYTHRYMKKVCDRTGFEIFSYKRFLFFMNQKFVLKKKTKIGIFTYDFYPFIGGAGRVAHAHYKHSKYKNDFLVFSCQNNKIKNHINVNIPKIKFGRYDFSPIFFSIYLSFNLKKIINRHKLRSIIIHSGPGGVFLIPKLNTKTYIVSHHTYYQQEKYLGKKFFYEILKFFEKKTYLIADKIFAVSNSTKNVLENKYGLKNKVFILLNGIDLKENKKIKKKANSIIFVGRLEKRKGINFLVNIMNYLPNFRLKIIGSGPEKKLILSKIKELNLKNIKLLGKTSQEILEKTYLESEYAIFPSDFEGFGLTALEAMSFGCVVLTSKTDGFKDFINNNQNGFLLNKENPEDWSSRILSLSAEIKNKISINAIKDSKKFDWKETIRELDENI
ncbi:MAG: hypothetical protein AUK08_00675 [Candidatus Pacebacteria bacterium CG2_30_36_39]|nr:MAG: hypothetical protein AUK08_00675 [Candidatus Pacebacteria bacterium CG2_30_36_39]